MRDELYGPAQFRKRAVVGLKREAPLTWDHSDDDANEKAGLIPVGIVPKTAAVLVGLAQRGDGLHVVLTQRHADLNSHGGQIAFPGGRLDAGETALEAALREAEEEIGLASSYVDVLGYLDGYLTVTGYFIVPVVAMLRDGYALRAQENEVTAIFDVPFSFLMDQQNRETHSREWKGLIRHYFAYPYEDRYIWGATAGIIKNMQELMYGD